MNSKIITKMNVKEKEIRIMKIEDEDYISLTGLAKYKNEKEPSDVIKND